MTTTNKWFIVPVETRNEPDRGDVQYPKYSDEDGITGFTGHLDPRPGMQPPLPGQESFIVRYYGDSEVIEAIADYEDTFAVGSEESEKQIQDRLNSRFGKRYPFSSWNRRFRIGQ